MDGRNCATDREIKGERIFAEVNGIALRSTLAKDREGSRRSETKERRLLYFSSNRVTSMPGQVGSFREFSRISTHVPINKRVARRPSPVARRPSRASRVVESVHSSTVSLSFLLSLLLFERKSLSRVGVPRMCSHDPDATNKRD